MNKLFFIKISIIIICIYSKSFIISDINTFFIDIKTKNEIKNLENLFKFCNDNNDNIKDIKFVKFSHI